MPTQIRLRAPQSGKTMALGAGDDRPRYVRIIESLKQRLAAKEWEPGSALPGEGSLAVEYGVSHGTMRKAVDYLVSQNLLVRLQGKGTYVHTHGWQRASHFLPLVNEEGVRETPTGRIDAIKEALAAEDEARRLEIRVGAKVVRVRRVRSFHGVPTIVERISLPGSRFPNFAARPHEELQGLLYGLYEKEYGIVVVEALERLRGVVADAAEARLLNVPVGRGLLEIDRIAMDIKGKPIEWRVSHCDTTRFHYENRII